MKQQLSLVTAILNLFWVGASAAILESYYPNATTSFFSSTTGPWLGVNSYTWSRYIWPTTVGTIEVIINTDTNKTFTTTRMNTGYSANDSLAILTRTDTNLAGTVTGIGQDPYGAKITAAYPTPVLAPATDFTWAAMLPSVYHGSSCCFLQSTKSLTPSHTPFASPTGATDTADPSGWLYTLVGVLFSDPETTLPSSNFSAMWTGQSFGFPYSGCPYTICDAFTPSAASATAVQSQAYLFVVRTVTTSGVDLLSLASGIPTASPPVTSGVEADPITAAPTSNPETSSLPSFSLFIQTSLSQFSAANAHQTVSLVSETPTLITKSTEDTSLLPAISTSQGETQPSKFVVTGSTNMKLSETTSGPQSTYSSTLKDSDAAQETVDAGALTNSLADASHSEPPTQTSDWMTTPVLTNCSSTISPNSASEYIIHTQTLRPGAAIAIFGSAISLASGVTEVVVGTSTETAASLSGLSGHIWSELGGGSTVSSNSDSGIFSNSGASSTPGTSQRSVTPNTDDRKTATELASSSAQTESSSDAAQPRRTGMGSAGLSIFALVLILV